jgi:hypothetical protein
MLSSYIMAGVHYIVMRSSDDVVWTHYIAMHSSSTVARVHYIVMPSSLYGDKGILYSEA